MMKKINALVTGVSGGVVGRQILKALKLSSLKLNIIGVDANKNSLGLTSVDVAYTIPYVSSSNKIYISLLLKICEKHNVNILFPGSEAELMVLSLYRDEFIKRGILLLIKSTIGNRYLHR